MNKSSPAPERLPGSVNGEERSSRRARRQQQKADACEEILQKFIKDKSDRLGEQKRYYSDMEQRILYELDGKIHFIQPGKYYRVPWFRKPKFLGIVKTGLQTCNIEATSVPSSEGVFLKARLEVWIRIRDEEGKLLKIYRNGSNEVENLWHIVERNFEIVCAGLEYGEIVTLSQENIDGIVEKINGEQELSFSVESFRIGHISAVDEKVRDSLAQQLRYARDRIKEEEKSLLEKVKRDEDMKKERANREMEMEAETHRMQLWQLTAEQRQEQIQQEERKAEQERQHELQMEQARMQHTLEMKKIDSNLETARLTGQTQAYERAPTAHVVVPSASVVSGPSNEGSKND